MSKLLYNTLKISGGENAPNAPPSGCAPDVIDYDYIESNHDYNRDYNCLETFSEKKKPFAWFHVSIISDNVRYE